MLKEWFLPTRLPAGALLVTVLRDPVARVFSKCAGSIDSGSDVGVEQQLAACALSPRNLNFQVCGGAACVQKWHPIPFFRPSTKPPSVWDCTLLRRG